MKFVNLILAGVVLAGCHKQTPDLSSTAQDFGIVHGRVVSETNDLSKSVVALVSATDDGQALCTGTILDDQTVLTAAHCVDSPVRLVVAFGSRLTGTNEDTLREADNYIQHPSWNARSREERVDLALVHFRGGLPDAYKPVTLAEEDTPLDLGTAVLMMGFGVTNGLKHKGAGRLRQTKSEISGEAMQSLVMVNGEEHSVCFGDSGGPAFVKVGAQWVQWGVAHSVTSDACDSSAFQTNVLNFEKWIRWSMKKLVKEARS